MQTRPIPSLTRKGRVDGVQAKQQVNHDIDMVLWSIQLHKLRRYFHQRFWEEETRASEFAAKIEPPPRLESVSEHSWHVAYIATLIAPRFDWLDLAIVLQLCLLHDITELLTGDQSPIGRDGTGFKTHAFNPGIAEKRTLEEETAIEEYERLLPSHVAVRQQELLLDYIQRRTQEALFVKSIDKLQTLAYILLKKEGEMRDKHIQFTLDYSEKGISFFPPLEDHFRNLQQRLVTSVARRRRVHESELRDRLFGSQLSFW
jgi:5'-deoxynucleotidase YfbR-like HD superfamily hydrolase